MNGILEDHLQSIEDFVLVEDKIVTYKWVSKSLKVHTNTAKQLLHAFATKEEFAKKLLVTYFISGEVKNESGVKFCLVNRDDVEKVKQSFEKVFFEHIYSVQRSNNFDAKDLYNADCTYELNEEDRKFSSIQKNEEDIKKRCKIPVNSIASVDSSNDKISKGLQKNGVQNKSEKTVNIGNITKSIESKSENTKPLQEKSAIVAEQRTSPAKETKTSPIKPGAKNKKLKSASTKGPSIGTFFNKQAALAANSKKEKLQVTADKEKDEAKENIVEIINRRADCGDKDHLEKDDSISKHTPVSKKKENTKKRKKRDKEHEESSNKRRKRIMVVSDSESSCSEMELDEEREPSPEPEPVPILAESEDEIIPPTPVEKGRKRVRKQVDRTFAGEDGFILTKKEYVYESCSDDEATIENNKETEDKKTEATTSNEVKANDTNLKDDHKLDNNKNKKVRKKSSPKKSPPKNKQQSIMNFFKKK